MPFIETRDGTEIYVKDWGDGPPVILIHGWPLSADSWDDAALAIAEAGHRVIAYDRRGFGRSDQTSDGYDYDTLADDLADVMEAADVEEGATLIGFSMGGGEVVRYMSRHGGRGVARIGLIGAVVPYLLKTDDNPDGVPAEAFEEMKEGIREDRAAFFETFFKTFYGIGLIEKPVSGPAVHASWITAMQAGLPGTLACVDSFGRTDFRGDLSSITVPALIIHGTSDKTVPIDPTARAAAKAIPGATLIEYDGAPHGLFASHKQRMIQDLLTFLGRGGEAGFMLRDAEVGTVTTRDPLPAPGAPQA